MTTDHTNTHTDGNERHVALEIPLILPRIEDEDDLCIDRLVELLGSLRGITTAHVESDPELSRICLHYDPNLVALAQVERLAHDAGAELTRRYRHEALRIEGMDCGDCAQSIEHVVRRMPGVLQVSVNYASGKMRVEFDSDAIELAAISERVRSMGFEIASREDSARSWLAAHAEVARSVASGLVLAIGFGLERVDAGPGAFLPTYILAYLLGGYDIARHGLKALFRGRFTIDLLMTVAAGGAAFLGQWAEGGLLLFLFSLGHALEEEAMDRARQAITALADLAPRTARVRRNDHDLEIPVAEVQRGDRVVIRAGERIPIDGTIVSGHSAVDESVLTGESLPVEKQTGTAVFAGSLNGEGSLEVDVDRLAEDTTLARVVALVSEAETQKSDTQRMVERIAGFFVPATLGTVALVWCAPPLLGWLSWSESFLRAMAVLVSASPCALAIATPAAVLSGLACAARRGVLIKGGVHLENLGRVRALAFDKTGTLTSGSPIVTDVIPLGTATANEVLALAAGIEQGSNHPLARAIEAEALERNLQKVAIRDIATTPGQGLRGMLEGEQVRVGTAALLEADGFELDAMTASLAADLEHEGKTVAYVHRGEELIGILAIADRPREEAEASMEALRALGIENLVMLTGDNPRVAAAVASRVGIADYRAGLLPRDKLDAIDELTRLHGDVGMLGDGVNDAPALARARVGIAMGAAGTDVALETADVALMGDDLTALPFTISLGRRTRRIIQQNLIVALGVVAILVPLSISGVAGIGAAIILHEGSTLGVVANALRLLRPPT